MTLAELIASELKNATRNDAEVLAWLLGTVETRRPLNSRELLRWGGGGGRLTKLRRTAADPQLPDEVRSAADAAVMVVSRQDTQLELADPNHEALVDALVTARVLMAEDKAQLVAMATIQVPRYAHAGLPRPLLGDVIGARG